MMYDPNIHHRKSIRLKNFDYSESGFYFVTLCTEGRIHLFGKIEEGRMCLNNSGEFVEKWWKELANRFDNVRLDTFVIMPNHIHGIIEIVDPVGADLCVCPPGNQDDSIRGEHVGSPLQKMIQWFKTMTTNEYIREVKSGKLSPFEKRIWQRNYWEHIIRNDISLSKIREYIENNPKTWNKDDLYN